MGQRYPFQNPELSSEERAMDLISRLTLEEKATLMCDQSDAIPRPGIKKFNWWSEALHGYANNDNVTVFPETDGRFLRRSAGINTCEFNQIPEAFQFWDENPGIVTKILIDVKG